MPRTDAEYRAILTAKKLPPAPVGVVTHARWVAGQGDWYVCVGEQWYWLDQRGTPQWKRTSFEP